MLRRLLRGRAPDLIDDDPAELAPAVQAFPACIAARDALWIADKLPAADGANLRDLLAMCEEHDQPLVLDVSTCNAL